MAEHESGIDILACSNALADAVEHASAWTVTVSSGDNYPSSGVIYDATRVLTTAHEIGEDDEITVIDASGNRVSGSLKGIYPGYDLALLEIPDRGAGGASGETRASAIRAGELVLALARPSDEGVQCSLGVVNVASGTYRPWRGLGIEGVMRSDAPRFPGFSGGPLIDVTGAFVGLNVFGDRRRTSLTLPASLIAELLPKMEAGETTRMGYLGVRTQHAELPAEAAAELRRRDGLLVVGLEEEGPALLAGILVGDIVVSVGDRETVDHAGLLEALASGVAGTTTDVTIVRGGAVSTVPVELGLRPSDASHWHGRHHHRGRRR